MAQTYYGSDARQTAVPQFDTNSIFKGGSLIQQGIQNQQQNITAQQQAKRQQDALDAQAAQRVLDNERAQVHLGIAQQQADRQQQVYDAKVDSQKAAQGLLSTLNPHAGNTNLLDQQVMNRFNTEKVRADEILKGYEQKDDKGQALANDRLTQANLTFFPTGDTSKGNLGSLQKVYDNQKIFQEDAKAQYIQQALQDGNILPDDLSTYSTFAGQELPSKAVLLAAEKANTDEYNKRSQQNFDNNAKIAELLVKEIKAGNTSSSSKSEGSSKKTAQEQATDKLTTFLTKNEDFSTSDEEAVHKLFAQFSAPRKDSNGKEFTPDPRDAMRAVELSKDQGKFISYFNNFDENRGANYLSQFHADRVAKNNKAAEKGESSILSQFTSPKQYTSAPIFSSEAEVLKQGSKFLNSVSNNTSTAKKPQTKSKSSANGGSAPVLPVVKTPEGKSEAKADTTVLWAAGYDSLNKSFGKDVADSFKDYSSETDPAVKATKLKDYQKLMKSAVDSKNKSTEQGKLLDTVTSNPDIFTQVKDFIFNDSKDKQDSRQKIFNQFNPDIVRHRQSYEKYKGVSPKDTPNLNEVLTRELVDKANGVYTTAIENIQNEYGITRAQAIAIFDKADINLSQ